MSLLCRLHDMNAMFLFIRFYLYICREFFVFSSYLATITRIYRHGSHIITRLSIPLLHKKWKYLFIILFKL